MTSVSCPVRWLNATVPAGWPLAADLQARPWGVRDFRLLDPAGYYLRITERRAAHGSRHPPSQ